MRFEDRPTAWIVAIALGTFGHACLTLLVPLVPPLAHVVYLPALWSMRDYIVPFPLNVLLNSALASIGVVLIVVVVLRRRASRKERETKPCN